MHRSAQNALLIDFGSTFTKLRVVDLNGRKLIAGSSAPSTVDTDLREGLTRAFEELPPPVRAKGIGGFVTAASSSAAGGLRIVAIGLVQSLTAEAAKLAALNAGGKVVATFANGLTESDVVEIERLDPDLILLAGGTDGGDMACITSNAEILSSTQARPPVIVAGNRNAAKVVESTLARSGFDCTVADNVLPSLDRMSPQSCADVIRRLFMETIVHAKGLDKAESLIGKVAMPTPQAVLQACQLAGATTEALGIGGDFMCVDIGGATTDVYSVGEGRSPERATILKGPAEPLEKRTVEADLGMRISAPSLIAASDLEVLISEIRIAKQDLLVHVDYLEQNPDFLPLDRLASRIDIALGKRAAELAVRRHVGSIEIAYGVDGELRIQTGKDLRDVSLVVGTGGVLAANEPEDASEILAGAVASGDAGLHLMPTSPRLCQDTSYSLFAVGLLAGIDQEAAIAVLGSTLSPTTN